MSDDTQMTVAPTPTRPNEDSRHTAYFLIVYYLLAPVWGVRHVYHDQPSPLDLLVPFVGALSLGMWAVSDARRRRHPIPISQQAWFFLLAGFVVPIYVVWSRGWRGVGWVVLHAILWYLLSTIALHAGGILIYGEAWLQAMQL